MTKGILVILGLAVFALAMSRVLMAEAAFECEACMELGGRSVCGSVAAPSPEEARARAISHACGILASGVTATLACERREPRSIRCRER